MLHISGSARRGLSAAIAALAIAGTGQVASAQAATFSVTSTPLATAQAGPATIALTKPGFASVTLTCPTLKPAGGTTFNSGTPVRGSWYGGTFGQHNCTGSNGGAYVVAINAANPLYLSSAASTFAVTAAGPGTFTLSGGPGGIGQGQASSPALALAWTNGSGATASTVSATNASLGTTTSPNWQQNGWTARLTGQWTIATTGGGLITALP